MKKICFLLALMFVIFPVISKEHIHKTKGVEIRLIPQRDIYKAISRGVIAAPPDIVWNVLNDFNSHRFMKNTIKSVVLSKKGNHLVVYKQIRVFLSTVSYSINVKIDSKRMITRYYHKSGPFKINQGVWIVQPYGKNSTMLIYESELKTDAYIPMWMQKTLLETSLPDFFMDMRKKSREIYEKRLKKEK